MLEIDISRKFRRMVKFGAIGAVVFAVLLGLAVYFFVASNRTLEIVDAKVSGSFLSVKAQTAGTLGKFLVKNGDKVKRGQAVVAIKVKVTEKEIAELEKNVAVMEENLQKISQGVPYERPVYQSAGETPELVKMRHLYEVGAISAAEYEKAKKENTPERLLTVETFIEPPREEVLNMARRQLEQAQHALALAKSELGMTELVTPVAGTAMLLDVAEGDAVRPGQPVVAIGDISRLVLIAPVTPERAAKLSPGLFAKYKLSGKSCEGTVLAVESAEDILAALNGLADKESAKDGNAIKRTAQGTEGNFSDDAAGFDKNRSWRVIISLPRDEGFWPKIGEVTTVKVSL